MLFPGRMYGSLFLAIAARTHDLLIERYSAAPWRSVVRGELKHFTHALLFTSNHKMSLCTNELRGTYVANMSHG